MTDNDKIEPIFIVKSKLPEGAGLIGKVEASEAVTYGLLVGNELGQTLQSRVRNEVIKKVQEEYGTQHQLYLVPTSYDVRNEVGGKTGHVTCDVYRV